MTRHVSDGERLTLAMLNKKEMELKEVQEELDNANAQLRALKQYIHELRLTNKQLCAEINYLVRKQMAND